MLLATDNTATEAASGDVLQEKKFLEISQNSREETCARVPFSIKLQALAHVFSSEFHKISKNTFFTENLWATASATTKKAF